MNEPQQPDDRRKPGMTPEESFKMVSDTVAGPNLRLKDNLIQGIAIFACLVVGAGIGAAVVVEERLVGAVAGAFVGLLVGLFASGIFLMIYRAVRHLRGRHD